MPLYDYDCAACGRRFETIHGVFADPPGACPLCGGGPIRKAIAAAAVHFKGSGWAKKERRATVPSGAGSKAGEDSTGDTGTASTGDGTASKGDGAPGSKDGGGASSAGSEPAGGASGSGAKEGSPRSTTSTTTSSSTTPTPPTASD